MNKFVAGFREGGGSFGFSHADDIHVRLAQTHGKTGKIAVAGDEAEAVDIAGIQDIHGVDDHRHVGRIFPGSIVKLLDRCDGIVQQDIFVPAVIFAPVAVNAAVC